MLGGDALLLGDAHDRVAQIVGVAVRRRDHGQVELLGLQRVSLHGQRGSAVVGAGAVAAAGGAWRHPGGYAIAINVKIRIPFSGAPNGHE